jgi:hypothetical protein
MSETPQPVWLYGTVEACKNSVEAAIEDLQRVVTLLDAVCKRLEEEHRMYRGHGNG